MTRDFKTVIAEELDRLQFEPAERYLLVRPLPIGLGGQIAGRYSALRLALATGRKAVFPDVRDLPYLQTFEEMTRNAPPIGQTEDPPLVKLGVSQDDQPLVLLDPLQMSDRYTHSPEVLTRTACERLGISPIGNNLLTGHILDWMRPTAPVVAYVDAHRQRLGIGKMTLGVHFRRGDKQVETAFVPAAEFNRQILDIWQSWKFESLFIASDSPDATEEVLAPPGVRVIFDNEERRYNNANHKMLMANPALAEQETLVAYKNIALLSACGGVVGQDNAHFATIAAAVIARRHGDDHVRLIEGRIAEKQNALLRRYFDARRGLRAVLRAALPFLSARARMRRKQNDAS